MITPQGYSLSEDPKANNPFWDEKREHADAQDRRTRLEQAGYNVSDIYDKINKIYDFIISIL